MLDARREERREERPLGAVPVRIREHLAELGRGRIDRQRVDEALPRFRLAAARVIAAREPLDGRRGTSLRVSPDRFVRSSRFSSHETAAPCSFRAV